MPLPSCPTTPGKGNGRCPSRTARSVWQRPTPATSKRTSPGPGSEMVISCRVK
ncbi:hypothetical protein ACFFX0_20630 [Citricoccus parietis]|uniref:Uncharacterized protein n=1 Tax=Citricoccus parietis TaxID=592307 RepID=A0ABV5G3F2_9MICC